MARKPQPPGRPAAGIIYRATKKGVRLGEVEATDEREAIEKAATEFKQDPAKLIAVQRHSRG